MSTGWQKIGWSTVWSRFVKIRSTSLAWQPTMLWNLRVTPMFGIHRNHWIRGLSQTLTLFSKSMNVPQIKADLCRQYSNSLCLVTVYWYLIPWFPRSDKISICLLVKSPLDHHQKRVFEGAGAKNDTFLVRVIDANGDGQVTLAPWIPIDSRCFFGRCPKS